MQKGPWSKKNVAADDDAGGDAHPSEVPWENHHQMKCNRNPDTFPAPFLPFVHNQIQEGKVQVRVGTRLLKDRDPDC